ncbi:hypothetical protein KP509_04G078500 [Ceratopteris richardii]|nr:hypothetical protein KP509_04G078500 [Ceratopteris richardii]
MHHLSGCQDMGSSTLHLLEMAADNDVEGMRRAVEGSGARVHECAPWYCRLHGSRKMGYVQRSPVMIAAMYGSMEVLTYLLRRLAEARADIDKICGEDGASVLHCAVASGTSNRAEVVRLLLSYGADPKLLRAAMPKQGLSVPSDSTTSEEIDEKYSNPPDFCKEKASDSVSDVSVEEAVEVEPLLHTSKGHSSSSPKWSANLTDQTFDAISADLLKSGIYSTDEFRMYSFKIRPCSRAYSHDWTECPFAHPGENARRRDPRRFHYSCVPCPDFRKGECRHGDACEYAHGVFESWLHPAQYRTRLCKDGKACTRKVCFFAHAKEEVRSLFLSAECASPSSKSVPSTGSMSLLGSSPSSSSELSAADSWCQMTFPSLRLPEAPHANRLRSTLSARNITLESQTARDLLPLSAQARLNAATMAAASSSAANSLLKDRMSPIFNPSFISSYNFEENLSNAVSPRSPLQAGTQFSPPHMDGAALEELIMAMSSKGRSLNCRIPQNLHGMCDGEGLSDMVAWGNIGSPSPTSGYLQSDMRIPHERSMASSASCLSPSQRDWGSPNGKPEWSVSTDVLTRFRKSYSCKA